MHRFWLEPCWVAQRRVTVAGVKPSHALSCVPFPRPMFPAHCLPLTLITLGLELQACAQEVLGAQILLLPDSVVL